jgi:WD40 repeat protein
LVAVENGPFVRLVQVATGAEPVLAERLRGPLAWHPNGKLLAGVRAGADADEICVVGLDGALRHAIPARGGKVQSLLWTRDGKRLIVGEQDDVMSIWDPETQTEMLKLHGPSQQLRWTRDGQTLLSAGRNGLALWHGSGFKH